MAVARIDIVRRLRDRAHDRPPRATPPTLPTRVAPTARQLWFIADLAESRGMQVDVLAIDTKREASHVIEALKYMPIVPKALRAPDGTPPELRVIDVVRWPGHPAVAATSKPMLDLIRQAQPVRVRQNADAMPSESPDHPSLSPEQLVYLLKEAHEYPELDYKCECDLTDRKTELEIAKDVAAMQILGGYIVIGADDFGNPVPAGVPPRDWPRFDEAALRQKFQKWLPQRFEIRAARHEIGGCTMVLIHVAKNVDGFCIINADGKYTDSNGHEKFVFRKGEVFARHGTSSERWDQTDIPRIIRNLVNAEKEHWRAEQREALALAEAARSIVDSPVTSYSWRLDTGAFDAATLELMRREDDIALRRALYDAGADAARFVDDGDWDEVISLIGRVASLGGLALAYDRPQWFDGSLETLSRIYGLGFGPDGNIRTDGRSEHLWLIVLEHLLALGALAVRTRIWSAVRAVTVHSPGPHNEYYPTWLRHGLTMASRANILVEGGSPKSLLTMARERVADLPALAPDLSGDDDRLLTSLCQFDILAAVTIIGATGESGTWGWYTNFARFYTSRSEPAVQELLTDKEMRDVLFPGDNNALADALREIDRMARNEGFGYDGYGGLSSATVKRFLDEYPPSTERSAVW